jgi:hypothetical protein
MLEAATKQRSKDRECEHQFVCVCGDVQNIVTSCKTVHCTRLTIQIPVRFKVFSAVTKLTVVRSVRLLLVPANVLSSSPILVTLMMEEAIRSSETSALKRATRLNLPDDGILHSHRRGNLKSYIALTGWALYWSSNVFLVRYELGLYIPEDDILHNPDLVYHLKQPNDSL